VVSIHDQAAATGVRLRRRCFASDVALGPRTPTACRRWLEAQVVVTAKPKKGRLPASIDNFVPRSTLHRPKLVAACSPSLAPPFHVHQSCNLTSLATPGTLAGGDVVFMATHEGIPLEDEYE
jgi:hypothetical protein